MVIKDKNISIPPKSLGYKIIDECKCGYEELFVLIGLVDFENGKELDYLTATLVELTSAQLLKCKFHTVEISNLSQDQLTDHLERRLLDNEDIESYPQSGKEFAFIATDAGRNLLLDKDKPIKKE